jgi:hypothetical protein
MRGAVAKRLRREAEEKTKGQPQGSLVSNLLNKFTGFHREGTTRRAYQALKKRRKEAV